MKELLITYWSLTTVIGMYWMIKNPTNRMYQEDDEFSLLELVAVIFPCALIAWAMVPMMLMHKIKFKRFK